MQALFIADAHISGTKDEYQKKLTDMLLSYADKIDALFILGDLFEFWTGGNALLVKEYAEILSALKVISQRGKQIVYLEGNHDFSLGKFFKKAFNAEVYPDYFESYFDKRKFFLAHGDTANQEDFLYRVLRKSLRSFIFSALTKIIPFSIVWRIGKAFGSMGRSDWGKPDHRLTRHLREFARNKFGEGYDGVLLAHLHYPDRITANLDGKQCEYINVGGWKPDMHYLLYNGSSFEHRQFNDKN